MRFLRTVPAVLFVLAGAFKLVAVAGFRQVLTESGTPLPSLFALCVPILEIGAGLALLLNKRPRLAAAALAVDMIFALALVGIPGARGARFHSGPYTVGGEPWRVPLEVGLLICLLLIVARSKK
jgi:uncharacterized membrane protein YphA (DoxX/SURF4 family)